MTGIGCMLLFSNSRCPAPAASYQLSVSHYLLALVYIKYITGHKGSIHQVFVSCLVVVDNLWINLDRVEGRGFVWRAYPYSYRYSQAKIPAPIRVDK